MVITKSVAAKPSSTRTNVTSFIGSNGIQGLLIVRIMPRSPAKSGTKSSLSVKEPCVRSLQPHRKEHIVGSGGRRNPSRIAMASAMAFGTRQTSQPFAYAWAGRRRITAATR